MLCIPIFVEMMELLTRTTMQYHRTSWSKLPLPQLGTTWLPKVDCPQNTSVQLKARSKNAAPNAETNIHKLSLLLCLDHRLRRQEFQFLPGLQKSQTLT
jgi:hypothetical protein